MASVPGHQHAAPMPHPVKTARRRLPRLAGLVTCAQCSNTGSVWVICPDAGAIKLPCECGRRARPARIDLADVGLAVTAAACFGGLVYFLI